MEHIDKRKDFWKRYFILLVTIAMQNVIVYGVNLLDNIMLGRYPDNELSLSAVALVNQVQFLLQMIINGVSDGTVVMSSRFWGEKNIPQIKKTASTALMFGMIFASALFLFAFCAPETLLGILTDKTPFIVKGVEYMRIVCFSYFFFAITQVLLGMLRSVETAFIGFLSSVASLFVNLILNYMLIFGHFGAPELGVVGAAIATLASRVVETLIVVIYLAFFDKKLNLKFKELFQSSREILVKFIKVSIPVVLSGGSWGIAMGMQTAILGRLEDSVVSANSIATTVFSIMSVFIYGSATAASVMIGKKIGQSALPKEDGTYLSDGERTGIIKHYARRMQLVFLALGLTTGVLLFLAKDIIIGFYNISEETRHLALLFMTVLSVTVVGSAYQMPCLTGIVRGGGDTKFVLFNDIIFMWGIVLPSSFIAAFVLELPAVVIFICLKADQILKCFVAMVKVNRFRWIKKI